MQDHRQRKQTSEKQEKILTIFTVRYCSWYVSSSSWLYVQYVLASLQGLKSQGLHNNIIMC
jgi:hypothetical protein